MNNLTIEQEVQAKGLTAPRVTSADIAANIAREHYFTAQQGVEGAALHSGASCADGTSNPLNLLTFCVLVLRNGFTVTGESACASPENFDAEIGRKIARDNAINKVWPLMGYQLRSELHRRAVFNAEPKVGGDQRLQEHVDMVRESGWTPSDTAGQQPGNVTKNDSGFSFGAALAALKDGLRVARAGWNGKGMFVYLVPANAYPAQTGAAKAFFGEGAMVPYNAYMAIKNVNDTVSTWAPSGSDALAEDWLIVE